MIPKQVKSVLESSHKLILYSPLTRFKFPGIPGKNEVNAFSSCLPKSLFPGSKLAARINVIYSELLLLAIHCCPSAGFLCICEHV